MLKSKKLLAAALVAAASMAGGACNCGARLALNGDTTVAITAPDDGASFLISDTVTPIASADNAAGLTSLALEVGSQQLLLCDDATLGATHIDCSSSFLPSSFTSEIAAGQIVITALAVSAAGISASTSITIAIAQPSPPDAGMPFDAGTPFDAGPAIWSLSFVQPQTGTGFPPTANVSAPSPLQMAIVGQPSTPVTSIDVTDEHGNRIASFTAAPYQITVNWQTTPGVGVHTLTGVAKDSGGESETANIVLTVNSTNCTSDASCIAGSRCCTSDGMCHPIVSENADCDCQHPCPLDEGCFPGTCGKLPQQCRPGCFPGSGPTESDPDGVAPGNCDPINGVAAYCAPLPPSQVTAQNQGGACAPGDGCDVVAQNCPNAPLYPGSDAGPPANPIVPYTCEPASVTATVCYPAGTHQPQGTNPNNDCQGEDATCGSDTAGCTKGYLCVGIEGDPGAGQSCSKQCGDPVSDPGGDQDPQCPNDQFCAQLFGDGDQQLPTGSCCPDEGCD